jgi:hypothetical protein
MQNKGDQVIFIQIKNEEKVQIDDMTRINVEDTFISPDEAAITLIEIEPETAVGYIDATAIKYLDWAYATEGDKVVTVRVTTDGVAVSKTVTISCLSVATDRLFSTDKDIVSHENDLYRYLRKGRNTFTDFHRSAQKIILDELDQRGVTDREGKKLTALDIWDVEEVKEWSKYRTLSLIFMSVQSEVGDVYEIKSRSYLDLAARQSTRAFLRLDLDNDGAVDTTENMISGILVRR